MNRSLRLAQVVFALILVAGSAALARAGAVAVGSSTLISHLDYSDTFTLTANGGEAGRTPNTFPVPTAGLNVENTYGNPAQSWGPSLWSISNDANVINGGLTYPGGSGAGSATGMTQTGGGVDYGLSYGLRSNYTLQADVVQTADRVDFTSGTVPNTIGAGGPGQGLSVFFRADSMAGNPYGGVGLYNGSLETAVYNTPTGNFAAGASLLLTGTTIGQWSNYAVNFDHNDNMLGIFVNQTLLKELNLATFAGGLYENYSNAAVSVGAAGSDRTWTDNFQVGAPTPEPSSWVLSALGLVGLVIARRRMR